MNNADTLVTASNKQRIALHFGRSAKSYSSEASLQHRVADQLLAMLPANQPGAILDLGCGSGRELHSLASRYPGSQLLGLDLSPSMLSQAAKETGLSDCWLTGDIDALPLCKNSVDLVYSSLAIQWCESLENVLHEVKRIVTPGACVALSTLAHGSLAELAAACENTDGFQHANDFPALAEQHQVIKDSDFELVKFISKSETEFFSTCADLLRKLKRTGVTTVSEHPRPGLMTPSQLRKIEKQFEKFREPLGLPLRYQVIYAILVAH